jgi:uncharacterized membrane protein YfcA
MEGALEVGCVIALTIGVALPVGVGAYLLSRYPGQWGFILIGSGVAAVALLYWLAGLPLDASQLPPGEMEALDTWGRLTTAYEEVCGAFWVPVSFVGGAMIGFLIADMTKSRGA